MLVFAVMGILLFLKTHIGDRILRDEMLPKINFAKSCTGQEKKHPKLKQIFTFCFLFMAGLQYNPADLEAYGCNTTEATELRLGSVSFPRLTKQPHLSRSH
jgi:hypothetical protein